jgi:CRISP-associated protein Cas1
MGYHLLSIDSPQCSLSCKDGQVTCRVDGEEVPRTIPLEDVASILITSFSASIHSNLLVEAAKHGVSVIFCESFQPISVLLPANRSTDTALTRAQVDLAKRERDMLWRRTVDAKCRNQLLLSEHWQPDHPKLSELRHYESGKHECKEAICARLHWEVFGTMIGQPDYCRERSQDGVNALLNYGYAVLLSTVLQRLFGMGLDPTFGIFHVTREHATPLAYDLMEPFRPLVDASVAAWVNQQSSSLSVTREFRSHITQVMLQRIEHQGERMEARNAVEAVARSFRRALKEGKTTLYKPWTPNATKWAGC